MGGVWRTAKRRKWTSYDRNGGPVHREGCGVPQNGTPRDTVHPPSTSSSLHLRLFIHGLLFIQPPLATVQLALSTGSCSTTPPWATVHPPLHCLLFFQPSTGSSCSSSPPRGPVHPAPTGSMDRGPVHPEATPRGPVHPPPPGTVHPAPPPQRSLFIQRQHRSASVSSSSEGIARSGSVNIHRSIARVQ